MLNRVWFWLLMIGLLYGFGKSAYQSTLEAMGKAEPAVQVTAESPIDDAKESAPDASEQEAPPNLLAMGTNLNAAMLDAAQTSVDMCIKLIGIMALWLGLLKIASDSGLVDTIAWMLRPLMRWLFPEVPDGHPAQGAMLMNLSANMLGLDNAATPMGLKAMQELQTLNKTPDTATNSMAMFLAINTSNVTLIPITIIAYRRIHGSVSPAEPIFGTLLVTTLATIVAIIAARWMSTWPRYRTEPALNPASEEQPQ